MPKHPQALLQGMGDFGAPVAAAALAVALPSAQKQIIGEQLLPVIAKYLPECEQTYKHVA